MIQLNVMYWHCLDMKEGVVSAVESISHGIWMLALSSPSHSFSFTLATALLRASQTRSAAGRFRSSINLRLEALAAWSFDFPARSTSSDWRASQWDECVRSRLSRATIFYCQSRAIFFVQLIYTALINYTFELLLCWLVSAKLKSFSIHFDWHSNKS